MDNTNFGDVIDSATEAVAATTPGDLLRHEFMEPLGLSANALAVALKVPTNRVTGILNGTRALTADTALRLARAALGGRLDEVGCLLAA